MAPTTYGSVQSAGPEGEEESRWSSGSVSAVCMCVRARVFVEAVTYYPYYYVGRGHVQISKENLGLNSNL